MAAQIVDLVNKERAAAGCGPVTAQTQLTRAAQDFAGVLANWGQLSHTGPDGSTPQSRIEAAGYPWITYGENIAIGQQSPTEVMRGWMNSTGHRENILNCKFRELGVGVSTVRNGPYSGSSWVQNFGTPR